MVKFRVLVLGALASIVVSFSASQLQASILYSQRPTPTAEFLWTSDFGTNPNINGFWSWESFSLASNESINSVTWWSASMDFDGNKWNPVDSDANDWFIDVRNFSNQRIYFENITASVESKELGDFFWFDDSTVRGYRNKVTLAESFDVEAGETYFFTIYAFSDSLFPLNAWWSSNQGDGESFQQSFNGGFGPFESRFQDRAFEFANVPEPATFAVWSLIGLCGVGYGVRRRRKKVA